MFCFVLFCTLETGNQHIWPHGHVGTKLRVVTQNSPPPAGVFEAHSPVPLPLPCLVLALPLNVFVFVFVFVFADLNLNLNLYGGR